MTSHTERAYFSWHARELVTGAGAIVDLGAWFGSTTAALAGGLAKNRHPAAGALKVHAFDRFVWESWMDPFSEHARFGPYVPGDSFRVEFDDVVRPWASGIEVHEGDLLEEIWDDSPIELLLVDAMKSWPLAEHITGDGKFYASLVTGKGHVIHQDYSNLYTPWIHLTSFRLREHLVPAHDVPRSETVVFRLVRSFVDEPGFPRCSRASFAAAEVNEAFEYSVAITQEDKHPGIWGSKVMLHIYDRELETAARLLGDLEARRVIDDWRAQALRMELARAQGA